MNNKIYLTDEDLQFYKSEGYLLKKGVYTLEEVQEIKKNYEKIWLQKVIEGKLTLDPEEPIDSLYRNLFQIHRQNDLINDLLLDKRNFSIAEEILGEEALAIATTIFFKAPGMKGTETHRDRYGYGYGTLGGPSCAVWLSLDDSDYENGGMYVVPKTQTLGLYNISIHIGHTKPAPEGYDVVYLKTEPGDIIIWDSLTVHGSTPNVTKDRYRQSFFMYFTGVSIDKLLDGHDKLVNKFGQTVKRPINRKHMEFKAKLEKAPFWGNITNDYDDSFRNKYITYLP